MTFYEAALRVLEVAGQPLHVHDITQQSIAQNLLSHVGKTPEETMLSRLAAMARRKADRRVIVTAKDTFGLVEWAVPEDPEALAVTGIPEPNPEADLPPYRPVERHPEPRTENARAAGRGDRDRKRGRRDEEEDRGGKKRRYPPISEVVFELLSDVGMPMKPSDLMEQARAKELFSNELSEAQVLTALLEDNQRRIDAGRRPQFVLDKATGQINLERAGSPSEAPPAELQAAFAELLGIPLEGGRPVLPRAALSASPDAAEAATLHQVAKTAIKDARRAFSRALRKRLADLEAGTFEKSCSKLLHALGFRELKVAKRGKEGPLMTARKRDGSLELRYAVRVLRGGTSVDRRQVQDLRKDLSSYGAQIGLLISTADVRGDAKTEATSGALILLWAGEGLADKFMEGEVGVKASKAELYEADDTFFEQARVDAEESARRREERHKEKHGGEERPERQDRPERSERPDRPERQDRPPRVEAEASSGESAPVAPPAAEGGESSPTSSEMTAAAPSAPPPPAARVERAERADRDDEGEEGDDGDDEGDDDLDAAAAYAAGQKPGEAGAPGQPGEQGEGGRRRRRRRRRGRRGRGNREGQPGVPGAPGAPPAPGGEAQAAAPAPQGESAAPSAPPPAPPPPPSSEPSSGGGAS